jgi:hypothetical protein
MGECNWTPNWLMGALSTEGGDNPGRRNERRSVSLNGIPCGAVQRPLGQSSANLRSVGSRSLAAVVILLQSNGLVPSYIGGCAIETPTSSFALLKAIASRCLAQKSCRCGFCSCRVGACSRAQDVVGGSRLLKVHKTLPSMRHINKSAMVPRK